MKFPMLEISKQCKISTFLPYGLWQKNLDLLDILYLSQGLCLVVICYLYIYDTYIYRNLRIYNKNGGSCRFVLAVGSVSGRSSEM